MKIFYLLWCAVLAIFMGWATWTGWSFADIDEVKSVPKSVRDNPGAYRAHYVSHMRYHGGK